MTARITVAVALDNRLESDLMVQVLRAGDCDVTLATQDETVLLAHARTEAPDVTVTAISYDLRSGGLIGPLLRTGTRVLAVGNEESHQDVALALLNGASGFLDLQTASPTELLAAVRNVAAGAASLHPDAAHAILQQWRRLRQEATSKTVTLTDREHEVLQGLARGDAVKQLARRMNIAEKTVEAHKTRLYSKLGVRSQGQAVSVALRLGLLPGSPR